MAATRLPSEPVVGEASAILQPAEAQGGQMAFRYVAPAALVLIAVCGTMYVLDRRRGGFVQCDSTCRLDQSMKATTH